MCKNKNIESIANKELFLSKGKNFRKIFDIKFKFNDRLKIFSFYYIVYSSEKFFQL